ncbi:hypothetical protein PXD04_10280 [Methanosphaera sp. ISO3-F5]|uniref:hypothetical protein n=1 Tax=Methanosphaera sp. ISO3-F5 TaxID=1452353 RepID=UPI002B2615E6|nr:hypothetical protein [Methanosphaera sp. ISO3-F5]WQH64077.1 hypothetical protein PXD04_10280 [Methanosphaera sp. ISO3-F5]
MSYNKFIIHENEGQIHLVPHRKTSFTNPFNHHKYLNNRGEHILKLLHGRDNWKQIALLSLEAVILPEGVNVLEGLDYKQLELMFRTIHGEELRVALDGDFDEQIGGLVNPSLFRTGYPLALNNNHLQDFVSCVLYELTLNADTIDALISEVTITRSITVGSTTYYFDLYRVDPCKLRIRVTDNTGESVNVDSWSYSPPLSSIKTGEGTFNIQAYTKPNEEGIEPDDIGGSTPLEVTGYNFQGDTITLTVPDVFHHCEGTNLIQLVLSNTSVDANVEDLLIYKYLTCTLRDDKYQTVLTEKTRSNIDYENSSFEVLPANPARVILYQLFTKDGKCLYRLCDYSLDMMQNCVFKQNGNIIPLKEIARGNTGSFVIVFEMSVTFLDGDTLTADFDDEEGYHHSLEFVMEGRQWHKTDPTLKNPASIITSAQIHTTLYDRIPYSLSLDMENMTIQDGYKQIPVTVILHDNNYEPDTHPALNALGGIATSYGMRYLDGKIHGIHIAFTAIGVYTGGDSITPVPLEDWSLTGGILRVKEEYDDIHIILP